MKRNIAVLLLLTMALALLSGCGRPGGQEAELLVEPAEPESSRPAQPAEAQPEAMESAQGGHDWYEPEAVDDSFRIESDGNFQHFLRAYTDQWVDDAEILDSEFIGIDKISFGWVCFSGTPKRELGWKTTEYEGKECFCRGLFFRRDENEGKPLCHGSRSIAMEPLKMRESFVQTEEQEFLSLPKELPALSSAELYVPQLGRSFVLTDPEALRSLEMTFSKPEYGSVLAQVRPAMGWMQEQDGFLPLYLHYADGSSSLAFAAGDGSDYCQVWDSDPSVFGAVSLFERFGVPLPSPGYTHNADGTTTLEEVLEGTGGTLQLKNRHRYVYLFDAEGRLICYEHAFHREDNDFDESETRTYFYRPDGKPDYTEIHGESAQSGGFDMRETYSYNERGLLVRFASDDLNDESRGMYYEYTYDEQDRLTAIIYHYRDGREGKPSGNSYFWYDEQGLRHNYGVDQDGHLTGGPEGDAGDRPVRR